MLFRSRIRHTGGVPVASSTQYDTALFATPQGWKAFNGAAPNTTTEGSPSLSNYGNGYTYTSTRVETDVSGQSLASVVALAQDMSVNTISTLVGVNAAALTGSLPAGSKIRRIKSVNTATPIAYRVSDGSVAGVTSLAGLIAAYPVPTTPTGANTASLAGLHGSAGCGATFCAQEWLRAAFAPGNVAVFYLCDIGSTGSTNCTAIGNGSYSLGTAADGTTPVLKFADLPAATSIQTFTRVFVERAGVVYWGWQDKPLGSVQTRLNSVAFEALAAKLGITPPTIGSAASTYAGTWSASYTGSDTGSCSAVAIDAAGYLNGSCVSTGVGGSFIVSGSVSSTGVATFTASGTTNSGATFSGSFAGATGSGAWLWASHSSSGTWSATKQ